MGGCVHTGRFLPSLLVQHVVYVSKRFQTMRITTGMLPIFDATPETFDQLVLESKNELVVVDFWGPGCPNCDVFAEAAPSLLQELGEAPVRIVKVNAYAHESLAHRFALFGIPTFLLFRDGKLLGRMSQYYGREYWLNVIRERLPTLATA